MLDCLVILNNQAMRNISKIHISEQIYLKHMYLYPGDKKHI